MYESILRDLRKAYDLHVEERESKTLAGWKIDERQRFLALLQKEGRKKLLDIGAGTGLHGLFFQENGCEVICTDLSPKMVEACQKKGLIAYEMDFLNLDFPLGSFEAIFAMNCLLHVPCLDLPRVLQSIREILSIGGLFYWGQYGGRQQEGIHAEDHYEPKRFFSFHRDEYFQQVALQFFEIVSFECIPLENDELHYQVAILRKS